MRKELLPNYAASFDLQIEQLDRLSLNAATNPFSYEVSPTFGAFLLRIALRT
jgi:hypothetical protein